MLYYQQQFQGWRIMSGPEHDSDYLKIETETDRVVKRVFLVFD